MIEVGERLWEIPIVTESNLRDAAFDQGYRIGPEQAAGWIFFRSASAPGEIALAALATVGPFILSVQHSGAAREMIDLGVDQAKPCARGHAAAFVFADLEQLYAGVSRVYRLSMSLPTLPLDRFHEETAGLGETEAEAITRMRIGQDIFRDALMDYWNGACPMTGITDRELLRASHIVPWAECTSDAQRLNVHNGLLLSSLWDAAFDAGLMSFDDNGKAIPSPELSDVAAHKLCLDTAPKLSLTAGHRENLAWHRLHRWRVN